MKYLVACGSFFFFSSRRRHTRWTGDWSSDVCSSDLGEGRARARLEDIHRFPQLRQAGQRPALSDAVPEGVRLDLRLRDADGLLLLRREIGRASCRERVVSSVVAVSLNKKT